MTREAWKDDAECRGLPTSMFFPEDRHRVGSRAYDDEVTALRRICFTCPVRTECFHYAASHPDHTEYGVWGGTTPLDRLSFIQIKCACGERLDPIVLVAGGRLACNTCRSEVS